MDFRLTAEQELLRRSVREFAEREIAPHVREWDATQHFPSELVPELSALGELEFATHPDVAPLWWALALGACLGGNGTLVGASANVVAVGIAERRGEPIGFWGFTRIGAPFAFGSLIVASVYLWLRYLAF